MQGQLYTATDTGYQNDVLMIRQDQTKHFPREWETGRNERGRVFFFLSVLSAKAHLCLPKEHLVTYGLAKSHLSYFNRTKPSITSQPSQGSVKTRSPLLL